MSLGHVPLSFEELYQRLLDADEDLHIEAKTSGQMSEAGLKTVSAFSNGRGGYLLLGVSRTVNADGDNSYEVVGISTADKLQLDLANQCSSAFNEVLRPEMKVHITPAKKRSGGRLDPAGGRLH